MDFPLLEICDDELGELWAEKYFHQGRLKCPTCGAQKRTAWIEGRTKRSRVVKYRCRDCRRVYTVFHGTVFAYKQIRPAQAILLLRGICKGESTAGLARELELKYDAVWFATEIWPRIRAKYPAAEFRVIGRKPVSAVAKLAELPGVIVTGSVPDVRPFVASATVAACPIRIARGLQNKVLEAMAMAKPTVAAPAAIAALGVTVGTHLLSPTTPDEWVRDVCDLFDDAKRGEQLGRAAREYVEEHHHWDRCLKPLMDAVFMGEPAA